MSSIKRTSKRSPLLARHFLTSRTKLEGTNQEKGFSLSRPSCPTERLGAGVLSFPFKAGRWGGGSAGLQIRAVLMVIPIALTQNSRISVSLHAFNPDACFPSFLANKCPL